MWVIKEADRKTILFQRIFVFFESPEGANHDSPGLGGAADAGLGWPVFMLSRPYLPLVARPNRATKAPRTTPASPQGGDEHVTQRH